MRKEMYNIDKGSKIMKGYQSVKLYNPNDTLMGHDKKTDELTNERLETNDDKLDEKNTANTIKELQPQ